MQSGVQVHVNQVKIHLRSDSASEVGSAAADSGSGKGLKVAKRLPFPLDSTRISIEKASGSTRFYGMLAEHPPFPLWLWS